MTGFSMNIKFFIIIYLIKKWPGVAEQNLKLDHWVEKYVNMLIWSANGEYLDKIV